MSEPNPFHDDEPATDQDKEKQNGLGYTPPQDIPAEQSVLGVMLLDRSLIDDITQIVKGKHFYRPAHELIYDAIVGLHNQGDAADPITVHRELQRRGEDARCKSPGYLHTLVNSVISMSRVDEHAEIIRERFVARDFLKATIRASNELLSGQADPQEVIAEVAAQITAAQDEQAEDGLHLMASSIPATFEWLKDNAANKGRITGVPTGFTDLDSLTQGWQGGQFIIVAARPAMGKALALDTPLPTPDGWTTMGNINVGDQLIGADGHPTRVVAATEVMHGRPCYEVEFSDGTVIVADAEHQWLTETRRCRRGEAAPSVVTTREIAGTVRCVSSDQRPNHSVLISAAMQLPDAELLVGPYTLGAWLGDGHTAAARITTPDPEVIAEIEAEGYRTCRHNDLTHGMFLPPRPSLSSRLCVVCGTEFQPRTSEVRTCGRSCGGKAKVVSAPVPSPTCPDCGKPFTGTNGMCRACRLDHGTLQALLRKIGVLGNKHIPGQYLRASEAQRRALLAGLLDSDGYCAKNGTVQFAVTREQLARDTLELVLSLGYKASLSSKPARLNGKDCGTAWTVTFTPADKVFRLPRKAERQRTSVSPIARRRFIVDVRPISSVPVRCVQIDNADHLYLASKAMVSTHNSTVATDFLRACSIKNRLPSVMFSLEMGRNEINARVLSAEARVGLHLMRSGHLDEDDWRRLGRHLPNINQAPLYVDDSPNLDLAQIRAKVRRMVEKQDLRLIVIDYLQLLGAGTSRRFESRQAEVSYISRNLKLLAKEVDRPVIALAQLNRGPEQRTDKRPAVSDLRESGSLEQDSDIVLLLHREDAYEKESARAGEADFIIGKHRAGPTATITTAFQGHYSRFVDMAQS